MIPGSGQVLIQAYFAHKYNSALKLNRVVFSQPILPRPIKMFY